MNFSDRVKQHMAEYKRKVLCIAEDGFYQGSTYAHVLPSKVKELNIIERFRDDLWSYFDTPGKVKLHRYFHHLNSSQAMCLNFFYPLFKERKLESLLHTLGFQNDTVDYTQTIFEKVSGVDGTNFDFYVRSRSGIEIFFEIKYTEANFGNAQDDDSHRDKFETIYGPRLNNLNYISDRTVRNAADMELFFKHYQLYRNLIHMGDKRYVVFIYPKENKLLRNNINTAMTALDGNEWFHRCDLSRNHYTFVQWEVLHDYVFTLFGSDPLADYYQHDFTEKYLNIDEPISNRWY